jgi:hypothetical protein
MQAEFASIYIQYVEYTAVFKVFPAYTNNTAQIKTAPGAILINGTIGI